MTNGLTALTHPPLPSELLLPHERQSGNRSLR
jgi:hypothetical protein